MPIQLDPLAGPNGGGESYDLAKFWRDQIDTVSDDVLYKRWLKRGEGIEKRYRDERARLDEGSIRHYSALWSNVEILFPALYGKVPTPIAERRFKDRDPVGRGAASMLERGLRNEIEICGFDEALQGAVKDYLLPGRGAVWVRYEPQIEESASLPPVTDTDMENYVAGMGKGAYDPPKRERLRLGTTNTKDDEEHEEKLEETGDRIIRESTPVDYVAWQDFFTFPARARVWAEVTAVGKRVYLSRKQMIKRFGRKIGKAIPLQRDDRSDRGVNNANTVRDADKGHVYEIWSREDQAVYWVAHGYDFLLDRKDDPLKLENFFPCPRPLYANATNNTLVPVPDYIQYQDQAVQIDELTQRIAMLTKACKMAGVYNAAAKDIQRLFDEGVENTMIPVDDWAAFSEKGGVEGNLSLLPVKDVIGILNELMVVKSKQIEEMDRLTGINDIMRGTTDARETLGAQRLKSNSSGTRLQRRQNEVARLARDTVRIMADIMAQHFSPQSLVEVSGALYEEGLGSPDMPTLTMLQAPPAPPPAPPIGAQTPAPMSPPAAPAMPPSPLPAAGGSMPPGGAPPVGQNVIPFKPQLPAPPQGAGPMPPAAPQMPMGAPPPPIPPEVAAKMEGLKRIAASIQLLRDEKVRGFRVDIEVDSTIYGDLAQEREDRTAFVAETTKFLQTAMEMGAQMPEAVPLLGKLLQFGVRGHKVGRDLEAAIEEFTDEAAKIAKERASQPKPPDPNMLKAQAAMLTAQSSASAKQQDTEINKQKAQYDLQGMQIDAQSQQQQAAAEVERQRIENEGEIANSKADIMIKQMDVQMRHMEQQIEIMRMGMERMKIEAELKQAQLEAKTSREDHERETEQSEFDAEQQSKQNEHDIRMASSDRRTEKTKADAAMVKAKAAKTAASAQPKKAS